MKKSKLSLGLIACLLSVGGLAGCDSNTVRSSSDGVLLSYTVDGGKPINVKADDILKEYYDDSSKYQAIFDSIYSVLKINYFSAKRDTITLSDGTKVELGKPQMATIKADAEDKVANDKKKATDNASENGTKYKKEFEAILSEQGVKTEEELLEKYIKDLQKERFDDNLYDYYVNEIRGEAGVKELERKVNGKTYTFTWNGYLEDKSPYHMSHIMVELSDSSDTNYSNGTISQENVESLYSIVSQLASGEQTFRYLAQYSDDTSSGEKSGDLGIMDYDTGFVNEFKLGIYAYEQLYLGVTPSYKGVQSKTKIDADDADEYLKQVKTLFGQGGKGEVPLVSIDKIEELNDFKDKKLDINDKPVIEGGELVLPRNVLYNKYLNRHAVFFIEGTHTAATPNFVNVDFNGTVKTVLCADGDPTKPIVCVRASSQGKQEIHFMVVNRSPFVADPKVSLEDYYTTYYYDQPYYPKKDGKKLDTYTSFLGEDTETSQPRADEVASKLKSFDSDKLTKYAFLKFMADEKLEFTKESKAIEEALMKWIVTSVEKKENEADESWTKTWDEYLDKLARQNSERKKLVPEICNQFFDYANDTEQKLKDVLPFDSLSAVDIEEIKNSGQIMDTNKDGTITEAEFKAYWNATSVSDAFNKEGGIFNDGKTHK